MPISLNFEFSTSGVKFMMKRAETTKAKCGKSMLSSFHRAK
jgi:hypothetical protein